MIPQNFSDPFDKVTTPYKDYAETKYPVYDLFMYSAPYKDWRQSQLRLVSYIGDRRLSAITKEYLQQPREKFVLAIFDILFRQFHIMNTPSSHINLYVADLHTYMLFKKACFTCLDVHSLRRHWNPFGRFKTNIVVHLLPPEHAANFFEYRFRISKSKSMFPSCEDTGENAEKWYKEQTLLRTKEKLWSLI